MSFPFSGFTGKKHRVFKTCFDFYAWIRQDVVGKPSLCAPVFLFPTVFSIQEKKFNTQNFVPEWGYYSVGMRKYVFAGLADRLDRGHDLYLSVIVLREGKKSEENVKRNFDWLFPNGIAPSGFFWDSGEKGNKWYGGDIRKPHTRNWHLIRKSGDGLYYIIKQLMLMEQKGIDVKPSWKDGSRRGCRSLCRFVG